MKHIEHEIQENGNVLVCIENGAEGEGAGDMGKT